VSTEARGLAASYPVAKAPVVAPAGGRLAVRATAFNTGRSVWLGGSAAQRGTVGLAWIWSCAGAQRSRPSGSLGLAYPVFPGESFEFQGWVRAPEPGGDCVLLLGLYSEQVAWFSDLGTPPVQLPVRVDVTG
jgi:hypothetical protein